MTFLGKFRAFPELPCGVMCFLGELRVGLMLALGGLRAGFMWLYLAWLRLRFCASPPASRKRRVGCFSRVLLLIPHARISVTGKAGG